MCSNDASRWTSSSAAPPLPPVRRTSGLGDSLGSLRASRSVCMCVCVSHSATTSCQYLRLQGAWNQLMSEFVLANEDQRHRRCACSLMAPHGDSLGSPVTCKVRAPVPRSAIRRCAKDLLTIFCLSLESCLAPGPWFPHIELASRVISQEGVCVYMYIYICACFLFPRTGVFSCRDL